MSYEMQTIRYSQQIFYHLIQNGMLEEESDPELFRAYVSDEEVMGLVKSQADCADVRVERFGMTIYLIPTEQNDTLGFTKSELKKRLLRSGATDRDYYLSQFVILTLLVSFYDGQGATSRTRDYMKSGELMNLVADRLRDGVSLSGEEAEGTHFAYAQMLESYESLKAGEGRRASAATTKTGFLRKILHFLEDQRLIEYIEADEMIRTTKKLDDLMDYYLLNRSNYSRVHELLRAADITVSEEEACGIREETEEEYPDE